MIDVDEASVAVGGARLLAPVTLRVEPEECVAIVGGNGAGKSTLLRLVVGELAPTSGSVRIAGAAPDLRSPTHRRRVAAMLAPVPLAHDLTVAEQAALVAATWGIGVAAARTRAASILDELDGGGIATRYAHELSSGQRQLAGLACVLVRPSDVLVLDEPEQRLDDDRCRRLAAILQQRRRAGATILVATHRREISDVAHGRILPLVAA